MWACSPVGQMYPWLHKNKSEQNVEGGHSPVLCTLIKLHLKYCVQLCGPQHKKDVAHLE